MIEYRVVNLRLDIPDSPPGDHLNALAADGWRVVACARSEIYLTVIMGRGEVPSERGWMPDSFCMMPAP